MRKFELQAKRIRKKLQLAVEADKYLEVSGAKKHQYILNEPVSIEIVEQFEKEHAVLLPECYKTFVTQVGNGGISFFSSGAGPFFGIYPFQYNHNELEYLSEHYDFRKPCPLYPEMTEEEWEMLIDKSEGDSNYSCMDGLISIGGQGDTFVHCLVINGTYKGKVVYTSLDAHKPFFTYEDNFLDWYERWLDEIISGKLIEKIYAFGWTMREDEKELVEIFKQTKQETKQIDILRNLLDKISTDNTAQALLQLIGKVNFAVKTKMVEVLIKYKYAFASDYLEELFKNDPITFYKFILCYAPDKALNWLPLIQKHVFEIQVANELKYCWAVMQKMSVPYSQYVIPFTNSTDVAIRRNAYLELRDYPEYSDNPSLYPIFQKGLLDKHPDVVWFSEQALKKFNRRN